MPVQGEASGGAAGRVLDPGRPACRSVRGHSSAVNTPRAAALVTAACSGWCSL